MVDISLALINKARIENLKSGASPTHIFMNKKDRDKLAIKQELFGMEVVVDCSLEIGTAYLIDTNSFTIDYSHTEKKKSLWDKIKLRLRKIWYVIKYGDYE